MSFVPALFVSLALTSTFTACGSKKEEPASAAKTSGGGTAAAPAPSASTMSPPTALADIDLSKAGDAWKGFHLKGLPDAEVTDNGTGGVIVNFSDNTMVQLNPATSRDVKLFKQGLTANYKSVTYSVDTPDELVFTTVSDMGGNMIEGYGFSIVVTAGDKKVECGSSYDDEATLNRMKDVCKSLAK